METTGSSNTTENEDLMCQASISPRPLPSTGRLSVGAGGLSVSECGFSLETAAFILRRTLSWYEPGFKTKSNH